MSEKISQDKNHQNINEKDLVRSSEGLKGFVKIKTTKDSRFGDVVLYQNKETKSSLFCKEKNLNTKELVHKEI